MSSGHEIVAVLTREDAPIGRKRILTASPVAQVATEYGLPTIKTNAVTASIDSQLESYNADLGIVVAYGALFKARTLAATAQGWINLHYSLLPKWRGAAPVQHSIWSGLRDTGVTLFWLDQGMDTGPIANVVETQIEPGENAGDLLDRLTQLGISGLSELLPAIEAGIAGRIEQQEHGASVAHKLTREHAKIDWNDSAVRIEFQILAMNPEPMAWCEHSNSALRVLNAVALGQTDWSSLSDLELIPGSLIVKNGKVLAACGGGTLLELKEIQPAGKQPMSAADWARGIKNDWSLS